MLLQLQRDGLIQRFSRSGTIVSPVDIHIYNHNIEIRTVLEGLAGELAAERISTQELEALGEILPRVSELEEKDYENLKELLQCEFDFHNLVFLPGGRKTVRNICIIMIIEIPSVLQNAQRTLWIAS